MSYYRLGPLLRERRVSLGYTQEELADGICAVNTLSRYENGERTPKKDHLEQLMQRLGLSDFIFDTYLDEKTFRLHELKYQIRQAIMENRRADAVPLLNEYEALTTAENKISKLFLMLYRGILNRAPAETERLALFESAITLTCPQYNNGHFPQILSYEEIILLNQIAASQFRLGNMDSAIRILMDVNKFYDRAVVNREEVLRTQPMILYNLTKYLGNAGRYSECIAFCDQSIRIAQNTGRAFLLCATYYNKAWSLEKRNCPGDLDAAKSAALLARHTAICMGQNDLLVPTELFLAEHFGIVY